MNADFEKRASQPVTNGEDAEDQLRELCRKQTQANLEKEIAELSDAGWEQEYGRDRATGHIDRLVWKHPTTG